MTGQYTEVHSHGNNKGMFMPPGACNQPERPALYKAKLHAAQRQIRDAGMVGEQLLPCQCPHTGS